MDSGEKGLFVEFIEIFPYMSCLSKTEGLDSSLREIRSQKQCLGQSVTT